MTEQVRECPKCGYTGVHNCGCEHVHAYCFGVTLNQMVERLRDPAIVECDHCDNVLNEGEILSRLNATSRLSAEDARYYHDLLNVEDSPLKAYADILEGK